MGSPTRRYLSRAWNPKGMILDLVLRDVIPWSLTPQIAQRPHILDEHPYRMLRQ